MHYMGHPMGVIPDAERDARALRAVTFREYQDADYLIPRTSKLVHADINEPVWNNRVPGCVLYAYVGDNVRIHVHNADNRPHSFHIHGIEYGIDSDGAWPMGTQAADGRRSDEICPGKSWTYIYQVRESMIGAWAFHDHSSHASHGSSKLGLFGGIIIRKRPFRWPIPLPLPERFPDMVYKGLKLPLCAPAKKQAKPARGRDPRTPLRARLTRRQELLLQNQYEDLREWLMRDLRLRFWPRPDWNTLHVPFFLHQMVSDQAKPAFDSGDMEENGAGTFDHTFDDAGSYEYFCSFHPGMTGTVNVVSGGPAAATVNILDAPAMGFYPDSIDIAPGGTVTWNNLSMQHHTVTSKDGAALVTHCINGRGFVGNTPTIIARAGQKIRWYVFNLDFGHEWHNFHPHNIRWELAGENHDVRSIGPADPFSASNATFEVRLIQMDIAVKDPRSTDSGWVFATYVYDESLPAAMPQQRWHNLTPVGLAWGNDPDVTFDGDPDLDETWINPAVPAPFDGHVGLHGRLNGPVDNPQSACMSCHSTAQVREGRTSVGWLTVLPSITPTPALAIFRRTICRTPSGAEW